MEHLLYLTHRIPYPPNKGDKVRSFHWLRHLSGRYRIHLGTFVDSPDDWQHLDTVRAYCASSHFAGLDPRRARVRSLSGLLHGEPLTLAYYRDPGLLRWVRATLRRNGVQRALVFSSAMAQFMPPDVPLRRVADFVDVDSDKWRQYAGTRPWPMSWLYRREADRLLAYERSVAAGYDATLFVNETEAAMFRSLAPECADRVGAADNGVDVDYFSPARDYADPYTGGPPVIAFTGAMDYWPNVDAVEWFAHEVLPGLRAARPDLRFAVVGARPTPKVQRLADLPGVTVTGAVPDIRPYLAHAALAVAPLRIARGTQNKVLEAMAMARPVIASSMAAAGVSATIGTELLVADSPADWMRAVDDVLSRRQQALAGAGRRRVVDHYSWAANAARIEHCLEVPSASAPAGDALQTAGT